MIVLNKDRKDQNLYILSYTHLSMPSTNLDDNQVTCYDRLRQNSMIFQRLTSFFMPLFSPMKEASQHQTDASLDNLLHI